MQHITKKISNVCYVQEIIIDRILIIFRIADEKKKVKNYTKEIKLVDITLVLELVWDKFKKF